MNAQLEKQVGKTVRVQVFGAEHRINTPYPSMRVKHKAIQARSASEWFTTDNVPHWFCSLSAQKKGNAARVRPGAPRFWQSRNAPTKIQNRRAKPPRNRRQGSKLFPVEPFLDLADSRLDVFFLGIDHPKLSLMVPKDLFDGNG